MLKNTAGQKIGTQMVSATDGSAFTSAVTVYVTGDAGTQAIGSVSSGACTHEGNGYHTYAPAQAETNYDLIAFTFIGTGAVPATVQVSTAVASTAQTGDSFAVVNSGTFGNSALKTLLDAAATLEALIKAKTDLIVGTPAVPGDAMTLTSAYDPAKTAAQAGNAMTLTAAYDLAKTAAQAGDAMNATQIDSSASAAANVRRASLGNVTGIIGSGSTTTSLITSSLSPIAVATDQFKGRILIFDDATITAQLRGQGTAITGSSSGGVLTVLALTTPPAVSDTFTIT